MGLMGLMGLMGRYARAPRSQQSLPALRASVTRPRLFGFGCWIWMFGWVLVWVVERSCHPSPHLKGKASLPAGCSFPLAGSGLAAFLDSAVSFCCWQRVQPLPPPTS